MCMRRINRTILHKRVYKAQTILCRIDVDLITQTTSSYGSELTSTLRPEQDWFCLVLGIPHWLSDQHSCLSYTSIYVHITGVRIWCFTVPPSFLGGWGTGTAPALNSSDGLRTRLRLYPAVSVDCHSACSQHLCMYICDRHFCSFPPWSGEYMTLLHYVHTVRMYLSYVLQVLMCHLHAFSYWNFSAVARRKFHLLHTHCTIQLI